MFEIPEGVKRIRLQTGNILNHNEIIKKAGQRPTEELLESLKLALEEGSQTREGEGLVVGPGALLLTSAEQSARDLTISVKVFVTDDTGEGLKEALDKLLGHLGLASVDSVVLSYKGEGRLEEAIPRLWETLETYATQGKVTRIGVADLDTDLFVKIHTSARIKPSVIQINLAHCCVVPPALQEFTKANDIQLLTHNDPSELVSKLDSLFGESAKLQMYWATKFQVHVKCRGVLATKGYVVEFTCSPT